VRVATSYAPVLLPESAASSHTHTCFPLFVAFHRHVQKVWSDRKKTAMEMVHNMAGDERAPKEVVAMVGLDTDEDNGVDLKAF
jgi:hypothetical protein